VLLNLPVRAAPIAPYAFGIQNTTRPIPFVLRTTQSSFTINVYACYHTYPPTIKTAHKLLAATPRTYILPFLIPVD